jgi:sortase A
MPRVSVEGEWSLPQGETLHHKKKEIELAPGLMVEREGRTLAVQPERPRVEIQHHQMLLNVPAIGLTNVFIQDHTVEEPSMMEGAGHFDPTGYPWQEGANTFIAGHRLGYKDTPSEHVFWDLPLLEYGDYATLEATGGKVYTYKVVDIAEVVPMDLWVTDKVRDKDFLSLQTCIHDMGSEFVTDTHEWNRRYIVRLERIQVEGE